MTENAVAPIDENTRRYYLDVMGVQCWELIDPAEQVDDVLNSARPVEGNDINLSLLDSVIQQCNKCLLHEGRKQAISGRGNQSAELMLVLLSPDVNDDGAGLICSGAANDLLGKMLAAIDISVDDVYITSLLKCNVPVIHTISTTELHRCNQYLKQQIQLVQPKLLVILGETAARCMLQKNLSLDDLRSATNTSGQSCQFESVPMFVSYSPQELMQQADNKRKAWQDLQQIQKIFQI